MAFWTSSLSMTARCRLDLFLFFPLVDALAASSIPPGGAGTVGEPALPSTGASFEVRCEGTMIGVWRGGGGHWQRVLSKKGDITTGTHAAVGLIKM